MDTMTELAQLPATLLESVALAFAVVLVAVWAYLAWQYAHRD